MLIGKTLALNLRYVIPHPLLECFLLKPGDHPLVTEVECDTGLENVERRKDARFLGLRDPLRSFDNFPLDRFKSSNNLGLGEQVVNIDSITVYGRSCLL